MQYLIDESGLVSQQRVRQWRKKQKHPLGRGFLQRIFNDHRGIEHAFYLEAKNRYVAFGLALQKFKQCGCCHPDYKDVQQLQVHVMDRYRVRYRIRVTREQSETWLGPPTPVSLDKTRNYLKMLLGRIQPDRDFKNGFRH